MLVRVALSEPSAVINMRLVVENSNVPISSLRYISLEDLLMENSRAIISGR